MWRYGIPYCYIRFAQQGDNMTLREEIDKARSEFQRTADQIMTADDIERIIDRIDDIEEIVINKEFDIVTRLSKIERDLDNVRAATVHTDERMDKLELKLFNLSVIANQPAVEIPKIPLGLRLSNDHTDEEMRQVEIEDELENL